MNSEGLDKSSIYDAHYNKLKHVSDTFKRRYKVTLNEVLFLASFVANFILSRLIHFGLPQEEVYNYYNDKRNVLNQWFVKRGWGWTTLVVVLFYSLFAVPQILNSTLTTATAARTTTTARRVDENEDDSVLVSGKKEKKLYTTKSERLSKYFLGAIVRYLLLTIWWVLFTQWCFGLPIMDKIFVVSGGACVIEPPQFAASQQKISNSQHLFGKFIQDLETLVWRSSSVSSYHCRKLRGNWEGGHDPLGHVFLMIHSSLYLYLECAAWFDWKSLVRCVVYVYRKLQNYGGKSLVRGFEHNEKLFVGELAQLSVVLLISLWWFMLLMTNMYFHSIAEKLVGLVFRYVGVFAIYFVPRWVK
ncbi:conserved hypothetical protein [Lodderomyces elongisporus NRRL YB-4239]|uniref:Acyl-coenzyme A diphosphatase SCS3 n=1 Tax=Lodderomyces elongisporus (strain ATCC 11503 / CBS 2605 / JCM 1781 / NBRC 1676 / NRRL YB-4239) TaxID=379508 RepID=A5E4A1_LODEL|nr:conserved hypothetical protein [Lodderomyces elongisporus NRRL YB-4239]